MAPTPARHACSTCARYAVFRGPKTPTSHGCSLWDVWDGRRHRIIRLAKQNFMTSTDSWVPKPSQIKSRGRSPARSRVCGSNTFSTQYRLMYLFVYPVLEQAKCHPEVAWVVHELRWVAAGQIMRGWRHRPSAETHSIAVPSVRFTVVPRCFLKSSLWIRTLRDLRTLRRTPVSSILYTFSGRIAGSASSRPMMANQCRTLSSICRLSRFQSIARNRRAFNCGWRK
jgi:hypothetical protein